MPLYYIRKESPLQNVLKILKRVVIEKKKLFAPERERE